MRYLRRRLERIPTAYLLAYVAVADVALFFGVVPFELYCRSMLQGHHATVILLAMLAANVGLLLFVASAMLVSTLAFGRAARRAALVTLPVRPRRISRGRSTRSGY